MRYGIIFNCFNSRWWCVVKDIDEITQKYYCGDDGYSRYRGVSTNAPDLVRFVDNPFVVRSNLITWYNSYEELLQNHFSEILQ